MSGAVELVHATAAALYGAGPEGGWRAVLLMGPSGVGKSDLALRLLERGWRLTADDYLHAWASNRHLFVRAPAAISGRIEVRGVGLVDRAALTTVRAALVVRCVNTPPERLPEPVFERIAGVDLPLIELEALHPSAPARVKAALRTLGRDRSLAY